MTKAMSRATVASILTASRKVTGTACSTSILLWVMRMLAGMFMLMSKPLRKPLPIRKIGKISICECGDTKTEAVPIPGHNMENIFLLKFI